MPSWGGWLSIRGNACRYALYKKERWSFVDASYSNQDFWHRVRQHFRSRPGRLTRHIMRKGGSPPKGAAREAAPRGAGAEPATAVMHGCTEFMQVLELSRLHVHLLWSAARSTSRGTRDLQAVA